MRLTFDVLDLLLLFPVWRLSPGAHRPSPATNAMVRHHVVFISSRFVATRDSKFVFFVFF